MEARLADSFLDSSLAPDSPVMPLAEFRTWFRAQRERLPMQVREIAFAEMDQWQVGGEPRMISHRSGKFFSLQGLRVETDFGPVPAWEQPIVLQPEIGILGVITRMIGGVRHLLLQAKSEPGNINGVQLAPTEQATRSNYTRVHGGSRAAFHEYFVEPGRARILVDRLQGEQGARILRKRNRNMIIEVEDDLPVPEGFCWLTLGQVKRLLKQDNLVNMSLRSVLSGVPLADLSGAARSSRDSALWLGSRDAALHSERELVNWLVGLRSRYQTRLEPLPVDRIAGWQMTEREIRHESGQYFSVIAVAVEASGREVTRWTQPILHHRGNGLNGFILQRRHGVMHFLVRACMYPGNCELFELAATVARSNVEDYFGKPGAPAFLDLFQNPPPEWVHYDAVHSEEGGRFHHYQNRYVILELPRETGLDLPENFRWMTLPQIEDFVRHGYFNIEARNLIACLDIARSQPLEGEPV